MSKLKANLGFKGNDGDSAYIIAVKNGFQGSEQDWLANLGTSSHFSRIKTLYTTLVADEDEVALPNSYASTDFVDVYVEGEYLDSEEYTIDSANKKVLLETPLDVVGTKVETIVYRMSTNELPIVTTINSSQTNSTVPGTLATYNYIETQKTNLMNQTINSSSTHSTVPTSKATYDYVEAGLGNKLNTANIQVITGSYLDIPAGDTVSTDVSYPTGFTKSNTVIIGKMVSSNSVYYDTADLTSTASGFPIIKMVALNDGNIRVWLTNTNSSSTRNGYFKITLMKVN